MNMVYDNKIFKLIIESFNKHKLIFIGFIGFVSGVIALILLNSLSLIELSSKTYAYVDVSKVINHVNSTLNTKDSTLSDKELKGQLDIVKALFTQELTHYSHQNNAVIFSSQKVIAGANDITAYIIKILDEKVFMINPSFSIGLLAVLVLINATNNASAKDFGKYGETHPIAEQDMIVYIQDKLKSIGNEELRHHQEKIRDKIVAKIKRPKPVTNITKASETKIRYFNPTFRIEEDIQDHLGNIIHSRGDEINPLDHNSFAEDWTIIDGDDPLQEEFARACTIKSKINKRVNKIILVSGSPGLQKDGTFYYFDQFGEISKKLSITKVPSIVKQAKDQNLIEIHEFNINGLEKEIAKLKQGRES